MKQQRDRFFFLYLSDENSSRESPLVNQVIGIRIPQMAFGWPSLFRMMKAGRQRLALDSIRFILSSSKGYFPMQFFFEVSRLFGLDGPSLFRMLHSVRRRPEKFNSSSLLKTNKYFLIKHTPLLYFFNNFVRIHLPSTLKLGLNMGPIS